MKLVTLKETHHASPNSTEILQAHVEYILPFGLAAFLQESCELLVERVRDIEDCPDLHNRFYDYQCMKQAEVHPKTMLMLRHGGFGDLLMLTPLIRLLKETHPGLELDFGCSPKYIESLVHNPDVRQLIHSSYIPLHDALMYDAVAWFDKSIEKNERTARPGTQIFADCLNIPKSVIDARSRTPIYSVDPKHKKEADWLIQQGHLDTSKKLIAIQVFGSAPQRGWPLAYIAQTLMRLTSIPNVQVLLFGQLPGGFPGADDLKHACIVMPDVLNLVNQTPEIGMCTALLEHCDLLIAPDSSFVHLAAALGVETIALYGPFPSWARGGLGWGRGGDYPKIHTIENGPDTKAKKLACQPCFQHAGHPCMKALNESGVRDGWSPCMKAIEPELVVQKALKLLGMEKEIELVESHWRANEIKGHVSRWRDPLPTYEVAATMKERSVRIGIIHGGAPEEQLVEQLRSMVEAKTFEGFKHIDLTILNNAQTTRIPKSIEHPGGVLTPIVLNASENVFPPVPYNDLMAFWDKSTCEGIQRYAAAHEEGRILADSTSPMIPDWLIVMDDDLKDFKEGWLQKMLTKAERMRLDCWAPEFCWFGEFFRSLGHQPGFASAIMGISREAFDKVGFFMEDTEHREGYLWHGFDSDYSARVGLAGLRSGVIPGSMGIAKHLGHKASLKRGLTHIYMAVKSNDFHYRRWRGCDPPKSHLISSDMVKPRQFEELGTEGLTWTVKRLPMPAPHKCEDVSVVIPTWNNATGLMAAIKSVEGKCDEIIVVDDCCDDDTQQQLEMVRIGAAASIAKNLKVLRNDSNLGFTASVNRGISEAKKENHAFILNDDAEVIGDSLWLLCNPEGLMLPRGRPEDTVIGILSMCHTNTMTDREECLHPLTASRSHDVARKNYEPMDWTGFCAVLIRREVIDKIGMLDQEHFPVFSSDREYCARARRAGFMTVCITDAEIYHHGSVASFKQRLTNPQLFNKRASMRLENEDYMRQLAMQQMQRQKAEAPAEDA